MKNMSYTLNGPVMVPENEIRQPLPGYTYKALRGYGYVLAVFDENQECIGWITIDKLGYKSARDWLERKK
jgi:hypothetical protein